MAFVRCSNSGGGTSSLKDFYRDKVLNSTFDATVNWTINAGRMTVNEGGYIGIDTTNRQAYFYVDFICNVAGTSSDWRKLADFGSTLPNYLPKLTTSSRNTLLDMITDESSTQKINFFLGYASSTNPRSFACSYGSLIAVNDRYIVYGSWTY